LTSTANSSVPAVIATVRLALGPAIRHPSTSGLAAFSSAGLSEVRGGGGTLTLVLTLVLVLAITSGAVGFGAGEHAAQGAIEATRSTKARRSMGP
jgi:hypothetical protein